METFTTTDIPVGETPDRLAITPDGARLYVTHHLHAHDGSISDLARMVSVIDIFANTVIGLIPLHAQPYSIVVSPDGAQVYVSHLFADTVSVIETTNNAVVATVPISQGPKHLGVTGDGSRVYVTHSGRISVIDATTYGLAPVIDLYPTPFTGMAVASDGGRIYAAIGPHGPANGGLLVVDPMASPPIVVGFIELRSPTTVALSADGSRCYVVDQGEPGSHKDDIVVVDTGTEAVVKRISGDSTLQSIAPDPTGHRVYVTTGSDTVLVIEAATDIVVTSFPLDGQAQDLAVTSSDVTVRHIYVSNWSFDKVSHTVSRTSFVSGELLSYGDAGTPGNVSDPVVVGFGGWQAFSQVFAGRNAAGQDRIYAVDQGGQLLSYGDAGTPGNVSDPVVVGFGGWQAFTHVFAGRNAAGQDRIYAVDQGGQLLSYGDAGTPGNVSDPVVVGFGGWQVFSQLFAGRNAAGQDRIYAVVA